MDVDSKLVHRLFYPQVPAVLAARSGERISAMPVVSYCSVSDSPPLVAVACLPSGFTLRLAVKARSFSLSLLDSSRLRALETLATVSGAKVRDKLREAGLPHSVGRAAKAPVILGASATLECTVHSKRKLGDHVLLVGEVRAAHSAGAFTDFWDFKKYSPVLYTGWKGGMTTYVPTKTARARNS